MAFVLLLALSLLCLSRNAYAEHGSSVPACNFSLAWHVPGFADSQKLALLESLITEAEQKSPGAKDQHRYFGAGKSKVGHTVTYLHSVATDPVLLDLWAAAAAADEGAKWNILSSQNSEGDRLRLRCFESIDYVSSGEGHEANIGWHSDGHTLLTTAVMLSDSEDFEGGPFQIRRPIATMPPHDCGDALSLDAARRGTASVALARGDALTWRGWDEHRVAPVVRGRRRVVVLEWWADAEAGPKAPNLRPEDSHTGWALARRIDPLSAALPRAEAEDYRKEGNLAEAVASYKSALALDPGDNLCLNNLAHVYGEQGAYGDAVASYQASLKIDPKESTTQLGLSNVLRDLGRYQEAVTHAKAAVKSDPKSGEALTALGVAGVQSGQNLKQAKAAFKKALKLNPGLATALTGLATIYKQSGKDDKALETYGKALSIDPNDASVHNNLGGLYMKMQKADKAQASFERAVQLNPKLASIHVNLGIALANQGKMDEAGRSFETAIKVGPATPLAHKNLARVSMSRKKYRAAEENLEAALRLDPKDEEARTMLEHVQDEL